MLDAAAAQPQVLPRLDPSLEISKREGSPSSRFVPSRTITQVLGSAAVMSSEQAKQVVAEARVGVSELWYGVVWVIHLTVTDRRRLSVKPSVSKAVLHVYVSIHSDFWFCLFGSALGRRRRVIDRSQLAAVACFECFDFFFFFFFVFCFFS